MTLFANVRHPYVATLEDKKIMARASQKQVDEITQRMIAMGHDGAVLEFGDGSIELVAFSPNDIKSATDNTGEFDRPNADVRYSKRDTSTNDDVFADYN